MILFFETGEEAEDRGKDLRSLEFLRQQKGPYEFGCQYLNDPVDDSSIEFKREWFRRFQYDEETTHLLKDAQCILSIDPAFKLKETHDQTGFLVSKPTSQGVYILEALGLKLNVDQLIDKVFELVEIYNPYKVKVETVAAQILLADALRKEMTKRGKQFMLDEYHPGTTQTKATRIRKLIPFYANGQILHRRGLVDLEEQLVQFPRGRRDDIIDSLAAQVDDWGVHTSTVKPPIKEYTWKWWHKKVVRPGDKIKALFQDLGRRPY